MEVILIQPKDRLSRSAVQKRFSIPLGLLTVAAPLDAAGYQVRIIDQRLEPDWEQTLQADLKTGPICVGITVRTGPQIWWALRISEFIKNNSNVPVVWGGVHGSILPEQTIKNPFVDILVIEEGEETFLELVKALSNRQSLEQVKGIWYKDGNTIKQTLPRPRLDLNQQPLLRYDLTDIEKYSTIVAGKKCLPFETSRGCPFRCSFCYNTCFHRRTWRGLSVDQTLLRIKYAASQTGAKGLSFYDDNFFLDLDRAYGILDGLVKENLILAWGKGDIRLDALFKLDDDYLKLIQKSGCLNLVIGIESGSQKLADALRKGIDVSQAAPLNRRLARYDLNPNYLFLVGTPDETLEDLAETGALMRQLLDENPRATIGIQIFVPYPGTELFDIALERGHTVPQKLEDWITYTWMNRRMTYPWLTLEKHRAIQMLAFCGIFLARGRNLNDFTPAKLFVSAIARLYSPIAQYRVKGMHSGFFPELKVAEILGYRGY